MAITLKHIQDQLAPELDALNNIIVTTLTSSSELTNSIVTTYLKNKGKLLRPIVTLLSAQFFGGINDKALQGAAALEMLHNASLWQCLWATSLSPERFAVAWPPATAAS